MPLKKPISLESTFASYSAVEIVSQGGSGTVYRATTDNGTKIVAIKILDPAKATTERRKRFKNELLFGMNARHPHVVTVSDHGTVTIDGKLTLFYVMPLYEQSLRDAITRGIMPEDVVKEFSHILDGVEAAHLQKVVHRDLKPENVLFDLVGKRWVVADFGIADFAQDHLYTLVETKPNTRLANFQYAAPEQRERNGQIDARTDIFALGLILNEMFTGVVAHGTGYKTIAGVAPKFAYLDEIVASMIQNQAGNRPASIEAIKRELNGRQDAFIESQKLSRLSNTVVPVTDVDDPITRDPIRLIGFDWDKGTLSLALSQVPNAAWIEIFRRGRFHRVSVMGKEPGAFQFSDATAAIDSKDTDVQRVIDFFKEWLPGVHAEYVDALTAQVRKQEELRRAGISREIEERERRKRVLENVKI